VFGYWYFHQRLTRQHRHEPVPDFLSSRFTIKNSFTRALANNGSCANLRPLPETGSPESSL
jgi:hypothetical protein